MKLSRVASLTVAVAFLSSPLIAAEDLSGTWAGSVVITMNSDAPRNDVIHMVLKQTGTELAGTGGRSPEQQWPLVKGKVTVAKVDGKESTSTSFDLQPAGPDGPALHFDLELIDGHLKGKANMSQEGQTMALVVDVTRVK